MPLFSIPPRPGPKAARSLVVVLALLLATGLPAGVSAKAPPGGPPGRRAGAAGESPTYRDNDYTKVNALYGRFVRDGQVNYAAWKQAGPAELDQVLKEMNAWPGLKEAPDRMRLAFLINAYNLTTIRTILDLYPLKSVKDVPGFFDKTKHEVAGGSYTLDELEKTIIRPLAGEDGLYHFGLVCGARGCPPLRSWAFQADSLANQLYDQTRLFVADRSKVRLESKENVLYVSELFHWYIGDFERGDYTLPRFIGPYFSLAAAMKFSELEPEVRYLPYDWSLNDAGPTR